MKHIASDGLGGLWMLELPKQAGGTLLFLLHGTFVRPPRMDIPEMEIDMSRLSI
ncbi:hypothetical protein [Anaerobaca lacustris]|uniref:Uncharacterized protein n=1 Tax=Anaerobaca lacustris TaxID=3044600 RepID=A0AAW6U6S9_9BACT|nr:hypothetical protein [Sedimentisphaerales bacterium M17dextr]